jgi:hypothetical protein
MRIATWSGRRLFLVCLVWIGVVGALTTWKVLRLLDTTVPPQLSPVYGETVVGISVGTGSLFAWLGIVLGPPILLIVAWLTRRARQPKTQTT